MSNSANAEYARQNVPAELTALINDTTGTLIASNYVDPHTKIAVIFGTGCNAAYMETAGSIPKIDYVGLPKEQGMAINVSGQPPFLCLSLGQIS